MILLTNDMLDKYRRDGECVCVCARFWGSSLQMDWDLTGIPMSCYDGVMKSLPLTKIVFTLRRCLAVEVCVCVCVCVFVCLNRVTSKNRMTFFVVGVFLQMRACPAG